MLTLQEDEVVDIKWFSKEEILNKIDNNNGITDKVGAWNFLKKYYEFKQCKGEKNMIKEILKYDFRNKNIKENILKKKSDIVIDFNSKKVKECIIDLNDTLNDLIIKHGKTRGIGLSAPQIGYSLSISIVDFQEKRYTLINPKIIKKSGKSSLFRIGCFSLYEYRALIKYDERITVNYYDTNEKEQFLEVEGDYALIIQHELDHLEGILLFDRLSNREKDLFIPREKKYISNHVPLKNYGFMIELKRRINIQKVQTSTQYYSLLFNDSYDYNDYIEKAVTKRKGLIDVILKYNTKNDKILEAGCGTSALSIYLSKLGYKLDCVELNEDMFELAKRMNKKVNGFVNYYNQDITKLTFKDKEFKSVYSHGVLEHFDEVSLIKAIEEGFRVAENYIISIPTIWDRSNNLLGDERLHTIKHWKKIFENQGYTILETIKLFSIQSKLKSINNKVNIIPSGNVIFVLRK